MTTILIANNNSIVAEGLKSILGSEPGNNVIGVVDSYNQLENHCKQGFPDLVIIDFSTAAFGVDTIRNLKQYNRYSKIMAITPNIPKREVYKVLKDGVDSYLLNDCEKPEILKAVEDTMSGKQFYCSLVLDILSEKTMGEDVEDVSLSLREIEVIRLISDGLTNKEIANNLHLSTHTVDTHRKNVMSKLGIKNTAGIVIYAVKENIIAT